MERRLECRGGRDRLSGELEIPSRFYRSRDNCLQWLQSAPREFVVVGVPQRMAATSVLWSLLRTLFVLVLLLVLLAAESTSITPWESEEWAPVLEPPAAPRYEAVTVDCTMPARSNTSAPEELLALEVLYNVTDGKHWERSSGWLESPCACDWSGVMCLVKNATCGPVTGMYVVVAATRAVLSMPANAQLL